MVIIGLELTDHYRTEHREKKYTWLNLRKLELDLLMTSSLQLHKVYTLQGSPPAWNQLSPETESKDHTTWTLLFLSDDHFSVVFITRMIPYAITSCKVKVVDVTVCIGTIIQARWHHHCGPQCKLWHAMTLKPPYTVLVTHKSWGRAAACWLADELAPHLYRFPCSLSCNQALKMTFLLIFYRLSVDLFRQKYMGIILVPKYTCTPSFN